MTPADTHQPSIEARVPSGPAFAMLPAHSGQPSPTLLVLAMAAADTLNAEPYSRVGRLLHARGWNVASLDLPCHGADIRPGEPPELAGWAARIGAGEDIAAAFRERVNQVVEHLAATGIADPTRIAAAGTSRGGYMAFQAAIGNPGIRAVAAFAPVTDLLALDEFAGLQSRPLATRLTLTNEADQLTDRATWIVIGSADDRVRTDSAIALSRALTQAALARGLQPRATLHVLPTPGHTSLAKWHDQAADWLHDAIDQEGWNMRQTLLAIDDVSLPLRKNACLYLSKPTVRPEPVLAPSPIESNAPDNLATHFYGTVLHDVGKYRMWYYACHRGLNPDWPTRKMQQVAKKPGWLIGVQDGYEVYQGPLCYAESDDGITWTKPPLGQVPFKGSRDNNALDLPHTVVSGASVIKDQAEPDSARRYKMVYQYFPDQTDPPIPEYGTLPTIACAVSPDGLNWTTTALPFVNEFVEHCSFMRHDGKYIVHSQVLPGGNLGSNCTEGGGPGGRTGIAHATCDFDHWPDLWEWSFALSEPHDPAMRGADGLYDQVHLGVGATSLGNVSVGLYGLWHNQPFGEDFAKVNCDLGLVVSNDGIRFREPAATRGHAFIHRDCSPATPVPGRDFNTILCQGNGILNVGDETRIYHGRWRNAGQRAEEVATHYSAEVALATLPRDRWGALGLNPGTQSGAICSAPVTLPSADCQLRINADAFAGLSVDLLDEKPGPIPGFTNGKTPDTGGLDSQVAWEDHALSALAGQTVRVQVNLQRSGEDLPRVYALYVEE